MLLFTPEDLLLYLYKESSPELTIAIKKALNEDWTLREKMQVLQSSVEQLEQADNKTVVAPRMEVILKVLEYARETAEASVNHP